jgi:hypothetical protein
VVVIPGTGLVFAGVVTGAERLGVGEPPPADTWVVGAWDVGTGVVALCVVGGWLVGTGVVATWVVGGWLVGTGVVALGVVGGWLVGTGVVALGVVGA